MDAGKGWRGKSMGDRCKVQLNSARISSRAKGRSKYWLKVQGCPGWRILGWFMVDVVEAIPCYCRSPG